MSNGFSLTKITKPIVKMTKHGLRFITKNSNVLLTIISATGVIATIWVTITGTIRAVKLCEEKKFVGAKEMIKTVSKCYIPTVAIAFLTTTAILCNGKINAKRLAVLTSAYSGSVETIKKIEEKMSDQIGPKKTQKAVDTAETELAKEHIPKDENEVTATGKGKQLFFLASTGQWFYSDRNGVELAELKVQNIIKEAMRNWGVSEVIQLKEVQEALDLPVSDQGELMGWLTDDFIDSNETVHFEISCDWMDIPWGHGGKEMVGVIRVAPWPINI